VNIEEAQGLWLLGWLRREDLPEIATQALVNGLDTPSLVLLAGLSGVEMDRAWDLWETAIAELGVPGPSLDDAVRYVAARIARRGLHGDIKLRETCRELGQLAYELLRYPPPVPEDLNRLWWFESVDDWLWVHVGAQPWLLERIERDVQGKLRALLAEGGWDDYNWEDGLRYVKGKGFEISD
jgi:hypothetical protein